VISIYESALKPSLKGKTGKMDDKRWRELMDDDSLELTAEEIAEGWHFCPDFDGLLIGPGMDELQFCHCTFYLCSDRDDKE
jgi:hypothetical protein